MKAQMSHGAHVMHGLHASTSHAALSFGVRQHGAQWSQVEWHPAHCLQLRHGLHCASQASVHLQGREPDGGWGWGVWGV